MGERGQIFVKDVEVYLYTHWGGEQLKETLAAALAKQWRWDDPEYLARIIFQEMIGDDKGETGFGIGSEEHTDLNWPLLTVDCKNKTVTEGKKTWTFKEFTLKQRVLNNI